MSSKSKVSEFSRGRKPPIRGGYMRPAMPIFKLRWAISVKSHVWKFGLDWLSLPRVIIWIFRCVVGGGGGGLFGRNPLLRGYMWPAMPIFELSWAILVKSHMWKFGSYWLGLSRVFVSTNIFPGVGPETPISGRGGYSWPVMPIFELGWAIPVKSHVWKFGLDWLKMEPLLGWVTHDLWGPFSNLAKVF